MRECSACRCGCDPILFVSLRAERRVEKETQAGRERDRERERERERGLIVDVIVETGQDVCVRAVRILVSVGVPGES